MSRTSSIALVALHLVLQYVPSTGYCYYHEEVTLFLLQGPAGAEERAAYKRRRRDDDYRNFKHPETAGKKYRKFLYPFYRVPPAFSFYVRDVPWQVAVFQDYRDSFGSQDSFQTFLSRLGQLGSAREFEVLRKRGWYRREQQNRYFDCQLPYSPVPVIDTEFPLDWLPHYPDCQVTSYFPV